MQRTSLKYTFFGILFGALFPLFASFWLVYARQLPYYLDSFLLVQRDQPLLWLIDTAPIFLGIFAAIAGARQAQIYNLNQMLLERVEEGERLVVELEQSRTSLEHDVNRQITQMKAVASVAREAAAIRDVDQLLSDTARLISEQFDFYHTGIFLFDQANKFAVLRASNSPGGERMLSRGHKLKVGHEGIVGYVAGSGEARIALDVGADAVFFDNPDLPETRSEMALPLQVRERSIGVLDVQSTSQNAFTQEDVETLQILADQIALAIDNARLLRDSQQALKELESFYGRQVRTAWQEKLGTGPLVKTYSQVMDNEDPAGLSRLSTASLREKHELKVAVFLRGQKLGVVTLRREANQPAWSGRDRDLVNKLSQQIALSLENARLLEETHQQAHLERLIAETTSRMRETLDIDTVLKTAAEEFRKALNLSEVEVRLGANVLGINTDTREHNGRYGIDGSHTPG